VHDPTRRRAFDNWRTGLQWPVVAAVTMAAHLLVVRFAGFSLRFRLNYARVALAAAIITIAWLIWRLSALSFEHARLMAQRRHEAGLNSLLMLAERVVKVVIALVTIFALLTSAGVDTTTALAGLGIGGLAVALGAQKTVENLLGGVFLLTDKALAVGDTCRIADRVGVIEDITLRSVQLRTLEQTVLSVPAGSLSQASVENFATRAKILMQTTLRLRYGTTAEQLRAILKEISALLAAHPDIEAVSSRIRLVDFGIQAVELELFAYFLTPDYQRFLAMREDVLLQVAAIVESAGTAFAQPTQFVYQERPPDPRDDTHHVDAHATVAS
jgi:MscS family membrane protein